jgi:hypothetical protein
MFLANLYFKYFWLVLVYAVAITAAGQRTVDGMPTEVSRRSRVVTLP